MAWALCDGFKGDKGSILVSNRSPDKLEKFEMAGCHIAKSNEDVVQQSRCVFLAVKPQMLGDIKHLFSDFEKDQLVVSMLAGVCIDRIRSQLFGGDETVKIFRIMPNMACSIGAGCCALSASSTCSEEDVGVVNKFLSGSMIRLYPIPERNMDAFTGLAGSGMGFVLKFIEALVEGAVHEGIPRAMALDGAIATVYGTSKLLMEQKRHPALVREEVCSPGGTTIHGIVSMEKEGFSNAVVAAVVAAAERGRELNG
eukprot:CAMPEP_0119130504 /NCGR_PEP_ID=MMETSP1310-20130426/7822_1 /TAXON_ID=464262 /ORGANISM="Genus nov. species nov., Strain RCC2339" /LENGTH=254 /DNA_ID=CAMNT_0007121019 /DNA_START=319 /DNA_END=1083 /DNA_ORIENTATION=-